MRAFKYVDVEHADAVSRGLLRIGTFESYSNLEGARRDEKEGILEYQLDKYYIKNSNYDLDKVNKLKQLGINIENSQNISLENIKFVKMHPAVFCFCMTNKINENLESNKKQAIFEIKAVRTLAFLLTYKMPTEIFHKKAAKVRYLPRVVDWLDEGSAPDPFIKDCIFEREDECRICWYPQDLNIQAFCTPEDEEVASLFHRVG